MVTTPREFYECAKESVKKIKILFVDKTSIEETTQNLLIKRWENVRPISGIRSMHFFKKIDTNKISAGLTASSTQLKVINFNLNVSKKK